MNGGVRQEMPARGTCEELGGSSRADGPITPTSGIHV